MNVTNGFWELDDGFVYRIKKLSKNDCLKAIELIKERLAVFEDNEFYLSLEIISLPLSVRSTNALMAAKLKTVRDVLFFGLDQLKFLRNVGRDTEKEITDIIEKIIQNKKQVQGMSEYEMHQYLIPKTDDGTK